MTIGKVWLVGAGPGDPGLITVRGRELLRSADAIVYDRLVPQSLVELARHSAERFFVGKHPDDGGVPQERTTELLIELAVRHGSVVRLKGGDPFVFGRGAEEAEALRDAGVPFQIVPGVTAAVAAPVAADPVAIPLLRRFSGVYLLDTTTVALPAALAPVWPGCGNGAQPVAAAAVPGPAPADASPTSLTSCLWTRFEGLPFCAPDPDAPVYRADPDLVAAAAGLRRGRLKPAEAALPLELIIRQSSGTPGRRGSGSGGGGPVHDRPPERGGSPTPGPPGPDGVGVMARLERAVPRPGKGERGKP